MLLKCPLLQNWYGLAKAYTRSERTRFPEPVTTACTRDRDHASDHASQLCSGLTPISSHQWYVCAFPPHNHRKNPSLTCKKPVECKNFTAEPVGKNWRA